MTLATFPSTCRQCRKPIDIGMPTAKLDGRNVHARCAQLQTPIAYVSPHIGTLGPKTGPKSLASKQAHDAIVKATGFKYRNYLEDSFQLRR